MIDRALAARLADVVMENLATRWPYHVIAMARSADEPLAPSVRTPMFDTCFDWHSSVHNHWALAVLRPQLDDARRARADAIFAASFTDLRAAAELAHLEANPGFERPYGLAWLCALGAAIDAPAIAPLCALARARLVAWARGLARPIRTGEHSQSMFAMALAIDACDPEEAGALRAAAGRLHADDRDAALHLEPSAHDFLSPGLGTAWLMTRVVPARPFARWLDRFAPGLGRDFAFEAVSAVDRVDGKLVHWDGLALSRAWMLDAIARALPDGDERRGALDDSAREHLASGLSWIDGATYAGAHWLPTFAIYAHLSFGSPGNRKP
jgi:hypothetical protein